MYTIYHIYITPYNTCICRSTKIYVCLCVYYIYIIINIDQYCTCTYDQCLNPLPATQLRSNNAWPRAPLQRPLRMQPAPRGRRATGDRDSVDLGDLGALDLGACWEVETPNWDPTHQIMNYDELWISISPNLLILNSKLPLHWWDGWLSAMSPLDGLMSGAQHQFRYNPEDFLLE